MVCLGPHVGMRSHCTSCSIVKTQKTSPGIGVSKTANWVLRDLVRSFFHQGILYILRNDNYAHVNTTPPPPPRQVSYFCLDTEQVFVDLSDTEIGREI
jgi:hypothetical protein